MRGGLMVIVAGMVLAAGCLNEPTISEPKGGEELVKYVAELPKVYVSDGTLLDPAYDSPDFPRVVQVLVGATGAEPNIGVTSEGGIFATAFEWTMRSTDGGHAWKRVYDFSIVDHPNDPMETFDPMLWVDPDTDRVFTNHMFPVLGCSSNIVSDDNGDSWTHYPMSCGAPGVDHQKLMTARPRGAVDPVGYENLVYYCYNKLVSTNCAVSYDGGNRFLYDTIVAGAGDCGGINGHPAAAPDGIVYVPHGLNCGMPHVSFTEDNGLTWTTRAFGEKVAASGQDQTLDIDPEITVTPDGTAYYYSRGGDGSGYLFRSKDQFATVDGPFRVNPPDVKGVIFAALMSGDDGRVAIGYLGNREWSGDPSGAPENTTWHLFVTHSFDAAAPVPTFQTHQVTPTSDPVQIGCVWLNGGGNPCRNMLDFIDGVADKQGRVHVIFTDGCTGRTSCANNPKATPSESRDRAVALAIQDHGPSLLASVGLLPSLGWTSQVNDPTGAMNGPKS